MRSSYQNGRWLTLFLPHSTLVTALCVKYSGRNDEIILFPIYLEYQTLDLPFHQPFEEIKAIAVGLQRP